MLVVFDIFQSGKCYWEEFGVNVVNFVRCVNGDLHGVVIGVYV